MKGSHSEIYPHLEALRGRELDAGGFSLLPGGEYRPDATAWATMALAAAGGRKDRLEKARARLASGQKPDGRVCISPDHPEAFWPTPLAILAWHGSSAHREPLSRAATFLEETTGRHFEKIPEAPVEHDTSVRGWPWIAHSHSMVEPTALALIALRVAGSGDAGRIGEGIRMLRDRQLPRGGWNYGNTLVYGQELYPQPGNTGLALSALAGRVDRSDVSRSLEYLGSRMENVRAPLSLGWGLLGLGAWGIRPEKAESRVFESFGLQRKFGRYDTTLLSLLILAYLARGGLESVLESTRVAT